MTDSNEKLKVSTDTRLTVYCGIRGPLVNGWGFDGAAAIDESGQWKADKRHC